MESVTLSRSHFVFYKWYCLQKKCIHLCHLWAACAQGLFCTALNDLEWEVKGHSIPYLEPTDEITILDFLCGGGTIISGLLQPVVSTYFAPHNPLWEWERGFGSVVWMCDGNAADWQITACYIRSNSQEPANQRGRKIVSLGLDGWYRSGRLGLLGREGADNSILDKRYGRASWSWGRRFQFYKQTLSEHRNI